MPTRGDRILLVQLTKWLCERRTMLSFYTAGAEAFGCDRAVCLHSSAFSAVGQRYDAKSGVSGEQAPPTRCTTPVIYFEVIRKSGLYQTP